MPVLTKSAPNRKALHFARFKLLDDSQGIFEGYLAVFGNVDAYGDVIRPGAFKRTIEHAYAARAASGTQYLFPILWQHDPNEPIGGFLEMREDAKGLYVKGQLDLDIEQGRRAYSGLKKGYIKGLSIGYETLRDSVESGIRYLHEIRLWEGSVVTFPANDQALVTGVKAASGRTDWPLADRDREWDGDAAHRRLVEWATDADGNLDPELFRSVHFWYDESAPENITSYKLPFCDVIGGEVRAIPRAIFAAAAALQGARGGVDIPEADVPRVRRRIETYYARMREEFDDDTLVPPWQKSADAPPEAKAMSYEDLLSRLWGVVRGLDTYVTPGGERVRRYYVIATYPDTCIIQDEATGQYLQVPWSMDSDGTISVDLSQAVQVEPAFVPVSKAAGTLPLHVKAGRRHSAQDNELIRSIIMTAFSLLDPDEQALVLRALTGDAPDSGTPDGDSPSSDAQDPAKSATPADDEAAILLQMVAEMKAARLLIEGGITNEHDS